MNKNILLSMISLLAVVITGCSDQFLQDKKNYDKYPESIFANEQQTGWYIDRLYADFFAGHKSPTQTVVGSWQDDKTKMTEEIGGTISDFINPNTNIQDAAKSSAYYGTPLGASVAANPYTRIRNCNLLIQMTDSLGKNLTVTFRNRAKGQMYFLRALQYFDLWRTYGGVPIVTTVQTASDVDETIKLPRATSSEMVTQIVKDLDMAASLLPNTNTGTDKWATSDYGRFTSGAALAVKSRVLLTYASPLFNKDWDNSSNQRWTDALNAGLAAEAKLTLDGYGLYGTTAKDWSEMFYVKDNTFCKEAIIVHLLSSANTLANNNGWEKTIRVSSQGGSGGVSAPKEMIDLFPMLNGSRPVVANGYDSVKFFLNRDPRFYRTFAFSGCKWGTKANANATIWLYRYLKKADGSDVGYPDATSNKAGSPAVVRKMSNPNADNTDFTYSGTDIFEYRYAELLLNIAECYAATNDIPKCLEYLGKIRARVGIAAANSYGIGALADKYAAISSCLYERRVELAYEGKRFWDVQRWMLYNDDASSGNNTCAKLGLAPINGTCRTGRYWQGKSVTSSDPIPAASKTPIVIDPDASDFNAQLTALSTLFTTYLVNSVGTTGKDFAMDKDATTNKAVKIDWKQNYYLFGLNDKTLTTNPWLPQNKGWKDAYGTMGTFDYQE
jgi:starch-binding outer membrane protein, SusD/RagB family